MIEKKKNIVKGPLANRLLTVKLTICIETALVFSGGTGLFFHLWELDSRVPWGERTLILDIWRWGYYFIY
jgi:hypothetical protein